MKSPTMPHIDLRSRAHRSRRSAGIALATGIAVALTGMVAPAPALAAGGTWSTSFETSDPGIDGTAIGASPTNFTGINNGVVAVTAIPAAQTNPGGESVEKIADASSSTKWFAGVSPSGGSPLAAVYEYGSPTQFTTYTVTSANDEPSRDPRDWNIAGSNNGSTWTPIGGETGQSFAERFQTKSYSLPAAGSFRYFKFEITANNGASGTQLADWTPAVTAGPDTPGPISLNVSSGPTGGWTHKEGAGFTGKRSAFYWGKHLAAGPVKSTVSIASGLNVAVDSQTELSYKIYPVLNSNWEFSATYAAIDVKFSDNTWISQNVALRDQYGFGATARKQGSEKALFANQWNSVKIALGSYSGKTVTDIAFTYDNDTAAAGTIVRGYVDDVKIQDVAPINPSSLTNYVETRRGTNSNGAFSRGTTIPATAVPNGFNFWTPFTNADSNTLYEYARANNDDNLTRLQGVGISHETSIWMGDSNQLVFMPSTSASTTNAGFSERAVPFSHEDEVASPEYYSVELRDPANPAVKSGLRVQVAPSNHGAVLNFTYPSSQSTGTLLIDGGVSNDASLSVTGNTFSGWVQGTRRGGSGAGSTRMYLYGVFDRSATADGAATGGNKSRYARFDVSSNKTLTLNVASSFISAAQAQKNFEQEVQGKTLTDVRQEARTLWNERLSVIDLSQSATANDADRVSMYSNLYRLNLYPNARWENTGTVSSPVYKYASAVGCSAAVGCATTEFTDQSVPIRTGKNYVNNGFWDTYRTAWPLYTFLYPDLAVELAEGFLDQYDDGGWVSRWSSPGYSNIMTGTSSDVSFADIYVSSESMSVAKAEHAYAAAVKNATVYSANESVGRKGIFQSIFLGYTASPTHETVSWGLEGFINDAGIAEMAQKLSQETSLSQAKRDRYAEEAEYYHDRAKNFVNMFNPAVGFFTEREPNGNFTQTPQNYDPKNWWGPYTETNGWNFAFHAPFDPDGLAGLYGDTTAGIKAKLDEFYATPERTNGTIHEMLEASAVRLGQLGMSNQVSHHIPYISSATGDPTRTQEVVRESLQRLFVGSDIGQGYIGDEDNGEMSAWYLFSALGFYPLALASGEYSIGSPLHDKVIVHRAASQGGDLTITAANNSYDNVYVSGVKVGSKTLTAPTLKVDDLRAASTLEFTMSGSPSSWGVDLNRSVTAPAALGDLTKASYSTIANTGITDANNLRDDTSATAATLTPTGSAITVTSTVGSVRVKTYTLTSAAKSAAPTSWKLEGKNGDQWVVLDERSGVSFDHDRQTVPFQVATPGTYTEYRLTLTGGQSLSEIELLVDPGSSAPGESFEVHVAPNLSASSGGVVSGAVGSISGAVGGATATVDFGDGSGVKAADVVVGGLGGASISANHTYALAGTYTVTLSVTVGGVTKSATGNLDVTRDLRFASNFDTACLTVVGTKADCDGNGYAYDKTSLGQAHETFPALIQGTEHSVPGNSDVKFTLPVIASGQPDNLTGKGQRKVRVNLGANATKVSFIGSANEIDQTKSLKLIYADGHEQNLSVSYNNWDASTGFGNIEVGSSVGRINASANLVDTNLRPKIWATPIANLATGHGEVIWLEMPAAGSGKAQIHIFAVASNGNQQATAPIVVTGGGTLSVVEGSTAPVTLASVSGGETFGDRTAVINWGNGSATSTATVAPDGTLSAVLPYTEAGTYTITITINDGVTSSTITRNVTVAARVASGLVLSADRSSVAAGGAVTLTAGLNASASGTVEFFSSEQSIGSVPVVAGKAVKQVSNLTAGVHSFTAKYSGDSVYAPATSAEVTVNVTPVVVPPATVAVSAPRFSKTSQPYNPVAKRQATVAVVVTGATSGKVTFKAGARTLGSAAIRKSGSAYIATLRVPVKLAVGTYSGVRATVVAGGKSVTSAAATQRFRVVKASTKKVTAKGKRFKKGTKPKVTVKVATLSSGRVATGRIQIRVGKKVVRTVKLTAKRKGKVTVTLPKRYAKSIKVRAKFVPTSTKTVKAKSSKRVTIRVR